MEGFQWGEEWGSERYREYLNNNKNLKKTILMANQKKGLNWFPMGPITKLPQTGGLKQ